MHVHVVHVHVAIDGEFEVLFSQLQNFEDLNRIFSVTVNQSQFTVILTDLLSDTAYYVNVSIFCIRLSCITYTHVCFLSHGFVMLLRKGTEVAELL